MAKKKKRARNGRQISQTSALEQKSSEPISGELPSSAETTHSPTNSLTDSYDNAPADEAEDEYDEDDDENDEYDEYDEEFDVSGSAFFEPEERYDYDESEEEPMPEEEAAPFKEDLADAERASASRRNLILVLCAVVIAFIALSTYLFGVGVFGYRYFKYGIVDVHIYNGTAHFASVEIEGIVYDFKPYSGYTIAVMGGELTLHTKLNLVRSDPTTHEAAVTDEVVDLETLKFHGSGTNWTYHIALEDSSCLALADVSSYYDQGEKSVVPIVGKIPKTQRLQELDFANIIYPHEVLPDGLAERPLIYFGTVACSLLNQTDDYISAQLKLRISERKKKQIERTKKMFAGQE